jgi:hypothetical protein
LGYKNATGVYARIERDVIKFGIDRTHISYNRRSRKYSEQTFKEAVDNSASIEEVKRKLKCPYMENLTLMLDALRWGIDISHFDGRGHNSRDKLNYRHVSLEFVFTNKVPMRAYQIKDRLIKEGIKEHRCEVCHRTEYLGEPIPLELNHINGNENDNSLENLQIICPNCHSQTPTFAGRNKMLKFSDDEITDAIRNSTSMTMALLILG